MRPLDMDDPTRIGDYRLLGLLGSGGMGRVYLGRSSGGRTVAVKVIRPDLIGDTQFRERFRREVTAARRVGGQFTAAVLDADVDADPPWLATGYVAGFSLTEAVEQFGTFTENPLLVLAHGLTEALIAVHEAGVVHRDLKPSNVLLAIDGPKVIDFGIARAVEDSALTTTGSVIGSPSFMCPEQVLGKPVGPAGDVFALGGVLVFAATGHGPFGVGETVQMLFRVVYEEPQLDGVPPRLHPLVAACLAKDEAARPTPQQLHAALLDLGVPQRAGWLPAPVLEEVSRRAVQLLDLDSGPVRVPEELRGQVPDPSRSAPTISRQALNYSSPAQSDPHAAPPYGAGQRGTPPYGQQGTPPYGSWPQPTDQIRQQGAPSYGAQSPDQNWQGTRSYTAGTDRPVASGQWNEPPADRADPQPMPVHGGQRPTRSDSAQPPRKSTGRRVGLIAGVLVAAVAIAVGAFVIGGQLKDESPGTSAATGTSVAVSTSAPSSAPETTTSATSSTTAADTPGSVPEAFVGHWTGSARDVLASFNIDLTIQEGKIGDEVAKSSNTGSLAGQKCSRAERLKTATATEITLVARLVDSPAGCLDNGSISTVTLQPDGSLSYSMPGVLGPITGVLRKNG
ncbi:protein kinase domain-containing protein [Nocardia sp. NBC_01009]|uniref:serine/threonine-protein kinase n=1 Tax=Nocardia sp. NBC_01009 TaxID=2975996 RepID=UPI00386709D5|nr:protein kinase [Nocardia sp. NBC_01009]